MNGKRRLTLPLIILAGVALRLVLIDRESLWFDELYNVWANRFSLVDMLREQVAAGHPPFFYLVARLWYMPGTGEVWVRSLSVLSSAGSILFVYLAGRDLFSRRAGLWAAALAAASPLLVWYARAANFYSFMIALTALCFWLLVRACQRGGWLDWILYTLAAAALLFTYFFGAVFVGAGWIFFLLVGRLKKSAVLPWLVSQAALLAVVGVTYVISSSAVSEPHRLSAPGSGQLKRLANDLIVSPFVLLAGKADSALDNTGAEGLPKAHLLLLFACIALVAVALALAPWLRRLLSGRAMIACLVFIAIAIAGPMTAQIVNGGSLHGRFYVWAAPLVLIVLGAVLAAAPRGAGMILGGTLLVAMLALSAWEIGYADNGDADWRAMMENLAARQQAGDIIASFPLHNGTIAADYYLPQPPPIAGGFPQIGTDAIYFQPAGQDWGGYKSGYWAGSGQGQPLSGMELQQRLSGDLAGADRVWLISGGDLFSEYPAVGQTFADGWVQSDEWEYPPFTLRLYERAG